MATNAGLIAGLGNPGNMYENTRHNLGFWVIDALLEAIGADKACKSVDAGEDCKAWSCRLQRSRPEWLLIKPLTYMNRSGIAVSRACGRFDIGTGDVLLIHDEMDLPLGRMKLKFGGGVAGHKGVASVAEHLKTTDFYRLRLGIGRPEQSWQAADYVLEPFNVRDMGLAREIATAATEGVRIFVAQGYEPAAQYVNSFTPSQSNEKV